MNELALNKETGYIESKNSTEGFTSQKKIDFLKIAAEIVETQHEWPNIGDVCKAVGIGLRSFYNHLEIDEKFAHEFHQLELHAEATCLSDAYALRKKNPMYMFGWLRAKFAKYDPSRKVEISVHNSLDKKQIETAKQVIETEILDESTDV